MKQGNRRSRSISGGTNCGPINQPLRTPSSITTLSLCDSGCNGCELAAADAASLRTALSASNGALGEAGSADEPASMSTAATRVGLRAGICPFLKQISRPKTSVERKHQPTYSQKVRLVLRGRDGRLRCVRRAQNAHTRK